MYHIQQDVQASYLQKSPLVHLVFMLGLCMCINHAFRIIEKIEAETYKVGAEIQLTSETPRH